MKQMMKIALLVAVAVATSATLLAAVRVDVRGTAGFYLATGVERVGTADGGAPVMWDTTQVEDGWWCVENNDGVLGITRPISGNGSAGTVDVLVLNTGASVVGGRMSQSEAWDDDRVVVVRDDVVVPSGTTLTLGFGAIVKFTEGARIVVEDGGAVVAEGAYLAAFDDDSVGGDTDMNEDAATTSAAPPQWWLDDPAVAALSMVKFVDGATNLPTRTYTAGKVYGALPELARDDAMFGGWRRVEDNAPYQIGEEDVVAAGETVLYAHWIPYELSIDPESADVGCLASEGAFAVTANAEWDVTCDAD